MSKSRAPTELDPVGAELQEDDAGAMGWTCHADKCEHKNEAEAKRCRGCMSWREGKRTSTIDSAAKRKRTVDALREMRNDKREMNRNQYFVPALESMETKYCPERFYIFQYKNKTKKHETRTLIHWNTGEEWKKFGSIAKFFSHVLTNPDDISDEVEFEEVERIVQECVDMMENNTNKKFDCKKLRKELAGV